jgi:hypothetical protein
MGTSNLLMAGYINGTHIALSQLYHLPAARGLKRVCSGAQIAAFVVTSTSHIMMERYY